MTNIRAKAIIAVFGGDDSDTIVIAEKIGGIIAEKKQILLTGGTRAGTDSVKHSAIAGVGSSLWVGVDRAETVDASESRGGFIIRTDLDHKRNYVEACLCDAAIGLKGGDGTLSEVTFALSLQRPVALLGDHWKCDWPLDAANRAKTLSLMVDRAFSKVGKQLSGKPSLDKVLNEPVIRNGLKQLPPYNYLTATNTQDVVDWISSLSLSLCRATKG
jgi:uncharacterized protein (TIGR00725 family)